MKAAAESDEATRESAGTGGVPGDPPHSAPPGPVKAVPVASTRAAEWQTARGAMSLDRARIMAVLNVTPDSFWDGGHYDNVSSALEQAETLVREGADLIDVGGESTRPGARAVSSSEERDRVVPVVREITRRWPAVPVSIDTVKADVAHAAMDAGAAVINDVSGLRLDHGLAAVAAKFGAGLVLMHSRGPVERMASYDTAVYGEDPVGEIVAELKAAIKGARAGGVPERCIVVDPGLGFSKRTQHSVATLAELDRFLAIGRPILLGPSRKRFVGEVAGGLPADERLEGTIAACVAGHLGGARIFRVHDVAPVKRALALAEAIYGHIHPARP